jgi:hemerythrin-like domain-containing protein
MSDRTAATAVLRDEHRLILRVVDALESIMDRARDGSGLALDDIESCVTFFRLFTDACHHGKEEDLLFVALEEYGLPAEEGPLGVMRAEHRLGRLLVSTMMDAVVRLRSGDSTARPMLEHAAAGYIDMLREHIRKEDGGLFDLADSVVEGAACARLCDAYQSVCQRRFEGRSREDLERIAASLTSRYAPATSAVQPTAARSAP